MSTTEHLTQSGEPDMRFKENKEAYGDDNNTSNNNYDNNNNNNNYDNNQRRNQGSHNQSGDQNYAAPQKRDGGPDMRFKENQDGEPYQMDNLRGQGRGADQDGSDNYDRNYDNNQNDGPSEHLTKEGEPDMRFKENKEAYGQS